MSELQKRVASSVVLLVLGLLGYFLLDWVSGYFQGIIALCILMLIFARLGYEWSFLVPAENSHKKIPHLRFLLPVIVSGIYVVFFLLADHILFMDFYYGAADDIFTPLIICIFSFIVLLHVISSFVRHFRSGYTDHPCFVAIAGVAYITLAGLGLTAMWQFTNPFTGLYINPYLPFYFMALVVIADTAAYFGGKKWGKHKLCPSISPGKTWEGFLSGFVAVIVVCLLCIFPGSLMKIDDLIVVPCIVLAAAVGDLYISLLKRRSGLKDVASLIPGHGGLLDRLDSHLMVFAVFAPVFFWIHY